MENRNVMQALRETLAILPAEDREERILLFTARMEALEAERNAECGTPPGWGENDDSKLPVPGKGGSREAAAGKIKETAQHIRNRQIALGASIILNAIELIIILVLLVLGGGRSDKPAELDALDNETLQSGYIETVDSLGGAGPETAGTPSIPGRPDGQQGQN